MKKVFLEISQNSQENTCARVSFLIKLQAGACKFIKKESLAQVSSREFWEISKNTFFYRTPLVDASDMYTIDHSLNLHLAFLNGGGVEYLRFSQKYGFRVSNI